VVNVRLPSDFPIALGAALSPQNIVQTSTPLTITQQAHVDIEVTSQELALDIMEFEDLILKPAINNLAGRVASDVATLFNSAAAISANTSGSGISTTLSTPNTATWAGAKAQLIQNSAPAGELLAVLDPISMARAQQQLQGLFNPTGRVSDMFDDGAVRGPALGISKWFEDQTVPAFTTGAVTVLPTINGAGQTGNVINITGGTGTFTPGDIITLPGCYAVNRVTKQTLLNLQQFSVTAATGSAITVYPAVTPISGSPNTVPFATVSASPTTGQAVGVVLGSSQGYRKNMVLHPRAITLATVDLPIFNKGVVDAARENFDGISMRCLQTYYPQTDQLIMRIDVLYGWAALRPEWMAVVPDVQ